VAALDVLPPEEMPPVDDADAVLPMSADAVLPMPLEAALPVR
jgi:hypothetical protein